MSAPGPAHPAWSTPYGRRLLDALVLMKAAIEAHHQIPGVEMAALPDFSFPCPDCDDPIAATHQVTGPGGHLDHAVPMCASFARWYEDR